MEKEKISWYDNANYVINLIIGIILLIVVCSQSFAISGTISLTLFGSVINHNSTYFLILIYFIFLKFSFGKKYFNYLNVVLMFLYFISATTSLLTMIQVFSLNTVLSFTLDFIFLVYLIHTFFRDTRVWKELKLHHSPFNEFTNEWSFYSIIVISAILLAVNLISTVVISGVMLSTLDACFSILFGRYIYLYREYLDNHKIDVDNDGNFNEIREDVKNIMDDVSEKIRDNMEEIPLDHTNIEGKNESEVKDTSSKSKARKKHEEKEDDLKKGES